MPEVTADDLLGRIQAAKEQTASAPSRTELLERMGAESRPIFDKPLPMFSPIPGEGREGPSRIPLSETGPRLLRGIGRTFTEGPGYSLSQVGQDIKEYAGSMVGNFFGMLRDRAIGGRGASPQESGQAFLGQVGDIATAATGGLMNPLGAAPGGTASGFRAGFGRGPQVAPEVPRPPGSQLALPPPAIGPAAPTRALPPPTVGVPGRPISTPGPSPEQFPRQPSQAPQFAFDRPSSAGPPTGAIPQPGATMRTVPEPAPRAPPTAAEIAGAAAGRDLPPRVPGTEGRSARAAVQPPMIPHGAERGHASPLATALFENDVGTIDRKLSNRFRQATGSPRAASQGELDMQDRNMTTAVDSMITAKNNIQFRDPKDPTGNTLLKPGRNPDNLSEMVQGVAYLKKQVFETYNQMATRATGQGAQVSLAPVVARLRQWAGSESAGITPAIRREALRMADEFAQRGAYSPSAAQEVVKTLNTKMGNFLNGIHTEAIYSHPTLMNEVRDALLGSLDETMARALGGPQYQVLRLRYGALSDVEGNLANALSRQLGKSGGWFKRGLSAAEATAALAGTLHGPAGAAVAGTAITGARGLSRYLNNPNQAVRRMFSQREASLFPRASATANLSARIASGYLGPRPPPLRDPAQSLPYVGTAGP